MQVSEKWIMERLCKFYHCSDRFDEQYPKCELRETRCPAACLYENLYEWFSELGIEVLEEEE